MSGTNASGIILLPASIALLAAIMLVGCRRAVSTQTAAADRADRTVAGKAAFESAAEPVALTVRQQACIRRLLAAGGVIEYDTCGYPTLIDLASDRVFADDNLIRAVVEFPALRRLRLAVSNATPVVLTELRSMTALQELLLQDAAVTNQDLSEILACGATLERLTLRRLSEVSDGIVALLAQCPHLQVLALIEMNGISGAALGELRAIKQLRSLDLRNCGRLTAEDFRQLAKLNRLDELKLGGPAINDDVLRLVAEHPRITSLTIEDAEVSGDCLSCLAAAPDFAARLRGLSLARCFGVTDESLVLLPKFPQLESLTLRDILVTGAFLAQLDAREAVPLPLKSLTVSRGFLSDDTLQQLPERCPRLMRLDLRGNAGITDLSLSVLRRCTQLEDVRLEDTGTSDPANWRAGQ